METIQFKKTPHITIFHTKGKRDNYKQIYICEEWSKGYDYFLIKEYYNKLIINKLKIFIELFSFAIVNTVKEMNNA